MVTVAINGRTCEVDSSDSVQAALESAGYKPERRLIVERNGEPLAGEALAKTQLNDGDRLEVVQLVGGG